MVSILVFACLLEFVELNQSVSSFLSLGLALQAETSPRSQFFRTTSGLRTCCQRPRETRGNEAIIVSYFRYVHLVDSSRLEVTALCHGSSCAEFRPLRIQRRSRFQAERAVCHSRNLKFPRICIQFYTPLSYQELRLFLPCDSSADVTR
jgi:hypothetical protein